MKVAQGCRDEAQEVIFDRINGIVEALEEDQITPMEAQSFLNDIPEMEEYQGLSRAEMERRVVDQRIQEARLTIARLGTQRKRMVF